MGRVTPSGDKPNSNKPLQKYTPPPKAMKLIETMLDPAHRMANVSRICEIAGVSRKYYYLCFDDERFVDFYHKAVFNGLKQYSAQLINIGIREARKGGTAGAPYWKVLLEMAELYKPKGVAAEKGLPGTINIVFGSPNDAPDQNPLVGTTRIEVGEGDEVYTFGVDEYDVED